MRYTVNMYNRQELLFQKSSDDLAKLTSFLLDFIDTSVVDVRAYIYDSLYSKVVRRCSKKVASL